MHPPARSAVASRPSTPHRMAPLVWTSRPRPPPPPLLPLRVAVVVAVVAAVWTAAAAAAAAAARPETIASCIASRHLARPRAVSTRWPPCSVGCTKTPHGGPPLANAYRRRGAGWVLQVRDSAPPMHPRRHWHVRVPAGGREPEWLSAANEAWGLELVGGGGGATTYRSAGTWAPSLTRRATSSWPARWCRPSGACRRGASSVPRPFDPTRVGMPLGGGRALCTRRRSLACSPSSGVTGLATLPGCGASMTSSL